MPVMTVENIWKRYRKGQTGYHTLREDIYNLTGRLFSLGGEKRRDKDTEHIWALRDVSFQVEQGERVGIIGSNGSGKTTLLRLLAGITRPTKGKITVKGRLGVLIEIMAGFHPELTGRENIYLNGAIMGMSQKEIGRKFDEIVAFAELENFIDTPIKRYSSGMHVRLGFAVAAHLDPEILLIDEVLAVGDAAFQQKCLGKMEGAAKEGRTVVFVSHNMGSVARLCEKGLLLNQGELIFSGKASDVIARYAETITKSSAELCFTSDPKKKIQMRTVRLLDHTGTPSTQLDREYPFRVLIEYEVREHIVGAHIGVMLDKVDGTPICHSVDIDVTPNRIIDREPGLYRSTVEFPGGLLNAGAYLIRIGIAKYGGQVYDYCGGFVFNLLDKGSFAAIGAGGQQRPGVLALPLKWKSEIINSI